MIKESNEFSANNSSNLQQRVFEILLNPPNTRKVLFAVILTMFRHPVRLVHRKKCAVYIVRHRTNVQIGRVHRTSCFVSTGHK